MEWTASGRIVAVRPHGETSAVIEVLTAEHG
ncbi:MAG TPA: DNA repair protein RecO, partial [Oceanicaulis sp.]|nr:DNA repair protein RecO [Oceanicaulis sp.]